MKEVIVEDGAQVLSFATGIVEGNPVSELASSETFEGSSVETLYLGRDIAYDYELIPEKNLLSTPASPEGTARFDSPFEDLLGTLQVLTVGPSVEKIGKDMFYGSEAAVFRTLEYKAVDCELSQQAFGNLAKAQTLVIGDEVLAIPDGAFKGFGQIVGVAIPASVREVGEYAFAECASLVRLTLEEGVERIGRGAFEGCRVGEVVLPQSLTRIEAETFSGCDRLTSICLPLALDTIKEEAFSGCSRLASVTFPASLKLIGEQAFYDCAGLQFMTSLAAVPPAVNEMTFQTVSRDIPVYVPEDAYDDYLRDMYWRELNLQPFTSATNVDMLSLAESVMVVGREVVLQLEHPIHATVYDLDGRCVLRTEDNRFALPQGVYIIKVGNASVKVSVP